MKPIALILFVLVGFSSLADVVGSKDTDLIARYTGSTIVSYSTASGAYDFLYGPVDKIKRDVSFENAVRIDANAERVTYEMPRGVSRDRAVQWFTDQMASLGASMLFNCEGPDCGRATIWASQVFRVRELSAPDRQQSYSAYELTYEDGQTLIALYVVERGNKRVIAHLEVIEPRERVVFEANSGFADQLAATGLAVVQGLSPTRDGSLTASDLSVVTAIGQQMSKLVARDVYVVCHIRVSGTAEDMLNSSQQCADTVATQLSNDLSRDIKAIGVGPFAPVIGRQNSRVEVVVPSLLRQVSQP